MPERLTDGRNHAIGPRKLPANETRKENINRLSGACRCSLADVPAITQFTQPLLPESPALVIETGLPAKQAACAVRSLLHGRVKALVLLDETAP